MCSVIVLGSEFQSCQGLANSILDSLKIPYKLSQSVYLKDEFKMKMNETP